MQNIEGKTLSRGNGLFVQFPAPTMVLVKLCDAVQARCRDGKARKASQSIAPTYCNISLACKKSHSACDGAGASGLLKASWGRLSTCVATANSSRSFLLRDVTIALGEVSTLKIMSQQSEKFALSSARQLTCSRCAWNEAASIGR